MDPRRFEELSRRFAAATDRRAALAAVVGSLALVADAGGERAAEAGVPIVHCKIPGQKCSKDKTCCSRHCNGGLCTCSKRGRACWQPLEGAL
ncbi:MAG TPA: hypothetical protein VFU81_23130, partial [Thermomicrobiales bacterium]|nr:hypothetical protein [Thermomicrobiales bacterium]